MLLTAEHKKIIDGNLPMNKGESFRAEELITAANQVLIHSTYDWAVDHPSDGAATQCRIRFRDYRSDPQVQEITLEVRDESVGELRDNFSRSQVEAVLPAGSFDSSLLYSHLGLIIARQLIISDRGWVEFNEVQAWKRKALPKENLGEYASRFWERIWGYKTTSNQGDVIPVFAHGHLRRLSQYAFKTALEWAKNPYA